MIDFDEIKYCNHCDKECISKFIIESDRTVLNQNKSVIHFSPGQVIIKQGSFASKITYIYSGIVKIIKEGKKGNNTLIKLVNEDNFLVLPMKDNQRKNAFTVIALTEVEICEINEMLVHNLIVNTHTIYDHLMESFFADQLFLMNRLHVLNTRNSHGKLAASLIYLSNFNKDDFSIFDHVTRKDLAELSSISLESVNKILQELKNDKIISFDNKGITISKMDLIEKLSQMG
jgi:CRP/FNR family transcriptional regulator, polysaccharide utilization system transcription regulator